MTDDSSHKPDQRLRGIEEQYRRAIWFVNLSPQALDAKARFRLEIAAVYPARAVVELMLESAEAQELHAYRDKKCSDSRRAFENELKSRVAHYDLIEKIRIHDFHRFGLLPPDMQQREMFFGGPINLVASNGSAILSIPPNGPQIELTGNSEFKDQRSLCRSDGMIYDQKCDGYLELREILVVYLTSLGEGILWFKNQLVGESTL